MRRRIISTILITAMILTSANLAIYAETEGADGQSGDIITAEQSEGGEAGDGEENGAGDESGSSEEPGGGEDSGTDPDTPDNPDPDAPVNPGEPDEPDTPDEPDVTEVSITNLEASYLGISKLTLTWDEIPEAQSYKVYRGAGADGTGYSLVKTVDENSVTETGLRGTWTYRYKIVPVLKDEFAEKGIAVNPGLIKIKMKAGAFKYTVPYVTVKNYKDPKAGLKPYNTVKWEGVSGAAGYVIYRAKTKNGKFVKIATVGSSKRSYNDEKARSGKYAYYKVRAYKGKVKKTYSKYSDRKSIKTIFRVYIACGHGTQTNGVWDGGCAYNGMSEAKLMLPITKAMVAEMRASGVYVYTDADKDNNLNMTYCVRNANRKEVSVYMSIHCDYSGAPTGTMPLYKDKEDLVLAKALNKGVHSEVSIPDRKPCKRWDLFELRHPKAKACCIFETGSIKYDNDVFRKKPKAYGRGLAKGLCSYLGVEFHN